jgi:hypothetical protein
MRDDLAWRIGSCIVWALSEMGSNNIPPLGAIETPTNSLSGIRQTRINLSGTKLPRLPDGA